VVLATWTYYILCFELIWRSSLLPSSRSGVPIAPEVPRHSTATHLASEAGLVSREARCLMRDAASFSVPHAMNRAYLQQAEGSHWPGLHRSAAHSGSWGLVTSSSTLPQSAEQVIVFRGDAEATSRRRRGRPMVSTAQDVEALRKRKVSRRSVFRWPDTATPRPLHTTCRPPLVTYRIPHTVLSVHSVHGLGNAPAQSCAP